MLLSVKTHHIIFFVLRVSLSHRRFRFTGRKQVQRDGAARRSCTPRRGARCVDAAGPVFPQCGVVTEKIDPSKDPSKLCLATPPR